jgi:hypothetical protein
MLPDGSPSVLAQPFETEHHGAVFPDGWELILATVAVSIPPGFEQYVEAAVLRFSYLQPAATVEHGESIVTLSDDRTDPAHLRRDFLHLVYRERIYAETLELRKELHRSLG